MTITATIKDSSTPADVIITRNGYVITDIWGHGRKVITNPTLVQSIIEEKRRGKSALFSNIKFWENIRDCYDEGPNTSDVNPALIWGPSKVAFTSGVDLAAPPPAATVKAPRKRKSAGAVYTSEPVREVDATELCRSWVKFFSEFHFDPQIRFINSIARMQNVEQINQYVVGYFSLTNNSYLNELKEKMKSSEYIELVEKTYNTSNRVINDRLEIYYGVAGGGKTTKATMDNPDAEVVVCHANLSPDELFRGFDFEDGKPIFRPCPVKNAMMEGKVVVLDEINLLNEDCRRTLQAICDQKDSVVISNEKIEIKKGFRIIGTMNLVVDEQVYGLPAPLVDRCVKIEEFKMTPARIASLAF